MKSSINGKKIELCVEEHDIIIIETNNDIYHANSIHPLEVKHYEPFRRQIHELYFKYGIFVLIDRYDVVYIVNGEYNGIQYDKSSWTFGTDIQQILTTIANDAGASNPTN